MAIAIEDGPARVVVIDDSVDIRDLLRFALSAAGMEVVGEAGDGRAGIEVVRAERPDLVMLDLSMPVMDGLEALPLIRDLVPDGRIVVFSGFDLALSAQLRDSGADGHITKGTPLREVVAYVEGTLSSRPR